MSSLFSTAQQFRAYFERFYPMTRPQCGIPLQEREMLINGRLLGTVISRGSWTMRLLVLNGTRKGKCFGSFELRFQYPSHKHDSGKRSVSHLPLNTSLYGRNSNFTSIAFQDSTASIIFKFRTHHSRKADIASSRQTRLFYRTLYLGR
jgi:hypothetical protein